jgi:hypothetical protein
MSVALLDIEHVDVIEKLIDIVGCEEDHAHVPEAVIAHPWLYVIKVIEVFDVVLA